MQHFAAQMMVQQHAHQLLALLRLAQEEDRAATLRCFEKRLLQELGYALMLEHEAGGQAAIRPEVNYRYIVERGPLPDEGIEADADAGMKVLGKTLLDMAADDYTDPVTAQQSKQLMRMLLNQHLGGKMLHTRELIKDLQKL